MRQLTLDRLLRTCPHTPGQLHTWLRLVLDVDVPRRPLGGRTSSETAVASTHAPFDYLCHTFFEGRAGPADCVVWAGRGTGKTFLGAVATLLDLVFKPGITIKILGGSLEQSQRMHEHLRRLFERPGVRDLLDSDTRSRDLRTRNAGHAQVLAASQTSVRGTRVQKLRCDEVDLFEPDLWRAAQLTTRSLECPGPWGPVVRGSIDALSTMHIPGGLMWELVHSGQRDTNTRRVMRWSILDVLGPCGPKHTCNSCPLLAECAGRVKERDATTAVLQRTIRTPSQREGAGGGLASELAPVHPRATALRPRAMTEHAARSAAGRAGFVSIDDALRLRARVDSATWESEMLCLRPRLTDRVYEAFDPAVHVVDAATDRGGFSLPSAPGRWIVGMDFGIRGDAAMLLARLDTSGGSPFGATLWIEREHIESGRRLDELVTVLTGWQREIIGDDGPGFDDGRAGTVSWPPLSEPIVPDCPERKGIQWIAIDPAGHARNDQTGVSNATVLRRSGFGVRSMHAPVAEGIALVRRRLEGPSVSGAGVAGRGRIGEPRLLVRAACTRLIDSLQKYRYDPRRRERLEPVKDGHDHACDALRYLVVNLDGRAGGTGGARGARDAGGRGVTWY